MGNRLLDGRYEIKKQLGNGGCATVYLCYDNKLHKNWAVKELTEAVNTERSMELEILKTVSCNAFPRIVDIVKEENRIFIIMDYIEGITLKEVMKRQLLTETEVRNWAIEIAKGICYLHQMSPQILYMDCKPDNIMLTPEGEIRLVDLGSVYMCRTDKKQRISGTHFFAPREQRDRRNEDILPDVRTDIYAFGMTLYYLLTGGKKEWRKRGRLCIKEVNPHVSWGMSYIIEKCTMENPRYRYQSMDEVIDNLKHIRVLGKQRAGKRQAYEFMGSLWKVICTGLFLYSVYKYQMMHVKNWLLSALLFGILLMISLIHRKVTMYEMKRDIFCGSGKRVLYFIMGVSFVVSVIHMTSYAAIDNNEMANEEELNVILYDSLGRKILVKDGTDWGVTEDIIMVIPVEEISENKGDISVSYCEKETGEEKEYLLGCYREVEK